MYTNRHTFYTHTNTLSVSVSLFASPPTTHAFIYCRCCHAAVCTAYVCVSLGLPDLVGLLLHRGLGTTGHANESKLQPQRRAMRTQPPSKLTSTLRTRIYVYAVRLVLLVGVLGNKASSMYVDRKYPAYGFHYIHVIWYVGICVVSTCTAHLPSLPLQLFNKRACIRFL